MVGTPGGSRQPPLYQQARTLVIVTGGLCRDVSGVWGEWLGFRV